MNLNSKDDIEMMANVGEPGNQEELDEAEWVQGDEAWSAEFADTAQVVAAESPDHKNLADKAQHNKAKTATLFTAPLAQA